MLQVHLCLLGTVSVERSSRMCFRFLPLFLSLSFPLSLIKIISFAYNVLFFFEIEDIFEFQSVIKIMVQYQDWPMIKQIFLNSWSVTTTFYFISATNIDDNVLKWIYTVTLRNTIKTCCKWEKLFIKQIHVT